MGRGRGATGWRCSAGDTEEILQGLPCTPTGNQVSCWFEGLLISQHTHWKPCKLLGRRLTGRGWGGGGCLGCRLPNQPHWALEGRGVGGALGCRGEGGRRGYRGCGDAVLEIQKRFYQDIPAHPQEHKLVCLMAIALDFHWWRGHSRGFGSMLCCTPDCTTSP